VNITVRKYVQHMQQLKTSGANCWGLWTTNMIHDIERLTAKSTWKYFVMLFSVLCCSIGLILLSVIMPQSCAQTMLAGNAFPTFLWATVDPPLVQHHIHGTREEWLRLAYTYLRALALHWRFFLIIWNKRSK